MLGLRHQTVVRQAGAEQTQGGVLGLVLFRLCWMVVAGVVLLSQFYDTPPLNIPRTIAQFQEVTPGSEFFQIP